MRTNRRILILVGLFQLVGGIIIAQAKKEVPSSGLEGLIGCTTVPNSANGIDHRSTTIRRGTV
jgi:hypothetical protein